MPIIGTNENTMPTPKSGVNPGSILIPINLYLDFSFLLE